MRNGDPFMDATRAHYIKYAYGGNSKGVDDGGNSNVMMVNMKSSAEYDVCIVL